MASLIVAPEPDDINVIHTGFELLGVQQAIERAGITWDGESAGPMVEGLVFGVWQDTTSLRKLLSVVSAAGVPLPSRGTYRFLADDEQDLRTVLREGIRIDKIRPSDLLIFDESVNQRTGRRMEGTSLVHSTTARRRILGHCMLNMFHSGADVSGFVDFEMKMNKKTKAGYRRRGQPSKAVARALHTPLRALALCMLDREKARGNQARTVVCDSGFLSKAFCRRLRRRGFHWLIAGKVDTPIEYCREKTTLGDLFDGVRSTKSAGPSVRYRVFNVVYPGYGPVRAFFVRFVDQHGDWHELYLLTDLTTKRASARAVLRKYLRRWSIEIGHRQTKETFNLRGYHGHTLNGHINFYALVLLAHQVAEAVAHLWSVQEGAKVNVPTLAFRVRLAVIQRDQEPTATMTAELTPHSRHNQRRVSQTMMGTSPAPSDRGQAMIGSASR